VEVLRGLRDRSVETDEQEKFVETYVSTAWKRYGRNESLIGSGGIICEPSGEQLQVDGDIQDPDMILLVGVQGSGKSEFTRLCRIRSHAVTVVSPDSAPKESGAGAADARSACEDEVGRFRKGAPGHKKVLILDRCNPTIADRKGWTSLFTPWGKIIAVYFNYPPSVCISRAENRSTHPTLPPHRARAAIQGTHKQLEPPNISEGFSGIAIVRCLENALELANNLFRPVPMKKFPRTRHLLNLGGASRDDLIIPSSEFPSLFNKPVRVEEKVDGANLGISLSATPPHGILVQNRSHYVSSSDAAQFGKLDHWLAKNRTELQRILSRDPLLPERYILFGEWVAATHSVYYDALPDLFLAFDLYDRLEDRFADGDILRRILDGSGISCAPEIWRGDLTEETVSGFLKMKSAYGDGLVEGVVVRWRNGERAKVVREDFLSGEKHWSKNVMRKNEVLVPVSDGL
jgi:atypical dual specificity phosphatase